MKTAVLYSGGKDSNYSLHLAQKKLDIKCLINMKSKNDNSYMFQSAGCNLTSLQSKSLDIPILEYETEGKKEKELEDLKKAIILAKKKYNIDSIVTGAIKSAYQSSRIQKICYELKLKCFNPIWQIDEIEFMKELLKKNFKILIVGIFAYPLTKKYLGKTIDSEILNELIELNKKYSISPAGEGGELETIITDSPDFKKQIEINKYSIKEDSQNSAIMIIEKASLIEKK